MRPLLSRSMQYLLGCAVATLCYAVTIKAAIGLGPLYVVQQGVARTLDISIGHGVMLVGAGLVVTALVLKVRLGPGTLALPVLSGVLLDALAPVIPAVPSLAVEMLVVLAATWVMALGGALVIRAAIGVAAYDAVMLGLGRLTRRPLAPVRLAMELTMLACGWLLGGTVGIGTVLTGVLIGPALQFWLRVLGVPSPATVGRVEGNGLAFDALPTGP